MQENKSQNAIEVIDRLKSFLKIKTDIQLAEFLNIRPNTISTWKKRNSLDYESIIAICELYELDLNEIFLSKKKGGDFSGETPLVTREVQFQYASGNDRHALMEILPKFRFPYVNAGNSLAFQVVSNNMFPLIDENSFVVCESEPLESVKENAVVVAVTRNKGIFLNRISRSTYSDSQYVLVNENEFYNDVVLGASEIVELWRVSAILSYDVNNQNKFKFLNDSIKKIDKFIKKNEIFDK